MDFLTRQQGIEHAQSIQYAKDHQARSQEWGGPYCLKQRIIAAIEDRRTSIVAAMINYQEPNISEIEEEIMIEYGYGSEEFEMNFRIPSSRLADFEITLRYPSLSKKRNPRNAGRKKTGEKRQFSVSGLSDELTGWIDHQTCKSSYLRRLIQQDYDKKA